jgi:hypothetical protein
MKLHRVVANEAQGPIPVGLILDAIIKNGKVTDNYQHFVLGQLSEFFSKLSSNGDIKSADYQLENPIDFESKATSTMLVQAIRDLADADAVALAQYLKDCIEAGESALRDHDMSVIGWMHYVLAKQR